MQESDILKFEPRRQMFYHMPISPILSDVLLLFSLLPYYSVFLTNGQTGSSSIPTPKPSEHVDFFLAVSHIWAPS
jgi:hypothetical protein